MPEVSKTRCSNSPSRIRDRAKIQSSSSRSSDHGISCRYSQHDLAYRNREHKEHCATRCAHRLVQDGAPCVTQPKHELTYLTASSSSPGYNANRYNTGQKNHGDLRAAHRLRERTIRWLVSSPFHNKALVVLGQTAARYTPSYSFLRHTQPACEGEGFRGRAPHMGRDDIRSTGRREGYNRPGLRLTTMDLEDVSHFHKRYLRQAYTCGIFSIPIARLATSSLSSQAPGQDRRR
jgi:hypothetical protein